MGSWCRARPAADSLRHFSPCRLTGRAVATAAALLVGASAAPDTCWVGGFSREFCCEPELGPGGNSICWDEQFQYEPCCTRPEPEVPETRESGVDGALLEQALGPKVDASLADGEGTSLESFEASLRQTIQSPEGRSTSVQFARALLAVVLRRQGRMAESENELRQLASHDLSISPSGAWLGASAAGYHMHDRPFADALIEFFNSRQAETVGDFGCGLGLYVRDFRSAGLRAGGFDGNPATGEITEGRCLQADLSRELDLGTRWHWVLSLEVAEHIPRYFEDSFLANLDRHTCSGMVLSWGNQAGEGHVNLRTSSEVEELLSARGFRSLPLVARRLRAAATLPWLQNTVLVFERESSIDGIEGCTR
ncbi:unnamed protein product [Polarella glacialis]|uniref:Methyltransferase n=1 Tax=Polarella glacialis TaxID=89957 RepID=A0A813F1Z5_POLGL|nr:unnamed protein product [Polarella glacialis]